ncbi:hypothetical protein E1A91_A01G058200v1 [Gossypium mustelinum]|uniref:Uncharacterized protein n=3 Tax=Gossypium TaxID=3633 RepID=A0A5J5WWR3_GOSBA|nr:hypothetical protein ES319_A01G056500v1 [Gossypium barbadense]TYH30031.1 hypothetical protein ES288_A01G061500v1 [Gossypium darwinii]TYJ48381.1 hypothetical protein E1A91_A01G058200v1 [Gossypium mustelinum]
MASNTETSKTTAEYIAVSPTFEPPLEAALVVQSKNKNKNKNKKNRRCMFLCFSNMQFENEEEKAKALPFLNSGETKVGMVMCCSNFQIGSEHEDAPPKIPK